MPRWRRTHDWVRRMEEWVEALRDLGELHPLRVEDLHEELVAVDELSLVRVLQLVRLDVLPQRRNDDRSAERIALEA